MSISIYELMENNPDLLNLDPVQPGAVSCAELMEIDQFNGENLRPSWEKAKIQAQLFRDVMKTLPEFYTQGTKGFVITYEEIIALMAGMPEPDIRKKGLKVYLGLEPGTEGLKPKLFALPCLKNADGSSYDDYGIGPNFPPVIPAGLRFTDGPGEARPCPDQCGKTNFMNSP